MSTVGLQDIAADLHVSVSLVSKVLNERLGTAGAKPQTIRAIQKRAQELGYRKHSGTAALATGRHNVLGVFIHRQGEPGSGLADNLLQGITVQVNRHHQRLLLNIYSEAQDFRGLANDIHRNLLDGALIAGYAHPELADTYAQIEARGVAIVTVYDEYARHGHFANVGVDQVAVGRLATSHLIAQGCRRIAHIRAMDDRFQGYQEALAAASLPYRDELVVPWTDRAPFTHLVGRYAAEKLLASGVPFDGLVASSDPQAVGAMHVLLQAGRRIPQDVKIIGVDDSPYCDYTVVPLSSVSQQEYARGEAAIRMLLEKVAGKPVQSLVIPPVLKCRESSK